MDMNTGIGMDRDMGMDLDIIHDPLRVHVHV